MNILATTNLYVNNCQLVNFKCSFQCQCFSSDSCRIWRDSLAIKIKVVEVLTVVTLKFTCFRDMMPYSLNIYQCFGGICLHQYGRRVLYRWRQQVPLKYGQVPSPRLHSITSQMPIIKYYSLSSTKLKWIIRIYTPASGLCRAVCITGPPAGKDTSPWCWVS